VEYDYEAAQTALTRETLRARPLDLWRYRELLPVQADTPRPHVQTGWTPIYNTPRLARTLGLRALWVKDEGRNPTGSFKDRASAIGVMKAREFGFESIACASTGNAASSLAGMAAAMGLRSYIFVPETAPEAKVAQLLIFGATVLQVRASYDEAYELCNAACEKYGWYNRNCAINAYLIEGKKTAGLEIAEQMEEHTPDWVVFAVGDGCTIAGVWKGLCEMQRLGFIERLPRLLGVQAQGAAAMVRAYETQRQPIPIRAETCADSICVGKPRNWRKATKAIRASHGAMLAVSDDEILAAMRLLAHEAAVFAEPAGATALAGLKKAVQLGIVAANTSALVANTGNGLKDVGSALRATAKPNVIAPNLQSLAAVVV
jgi:threonine synthase